MEHLYDPPVELWDRFVSSYPQAHLLQTSRWGALKAGFGWRVRRVALVEEGQFLAGAQVLLRPFFPRWPQGPCLAYVPKGPLVQWEDLITVAELLSALHPLAQQEHAVCLTVEPEWERSDWLEARLGRCGFHPSAQTIQPPRTIHVDLGPPEAAILGAMNSKTRYNIRLAQRREVQVRPGGAEDLPTFYRLSQITSQRDRFPIHSFGYYQRAYESFVPAGLACLLLAEYQAQPLAALMTFACGLHAWYFYGASSNEERNRMPNYALQWEAMRWAKAKGCTIYDLWGIPDEEESALESQFLERDEGLWGVYRFKRGFGGRVVRYIGAYDYVYQPALYRLYRLALQRRGGEAH